MTELFEALMLTAFSVSWYCSIWKMLRTRQAAGKSLVFVMIICTGYVFGIASKITLYGETGQMSPLIYLYCWNLIVTGFDAWLVWYLPRRFSPVPAPVVRGRAGVR